MASGIDPVNVQIGDEVSLTVCTEETVGIVVLGEEQADLERQIARRPNVKVLVRPVSWKKLRGSLYDLLGEEGSRSENTGARYRWVVDPLDGTTNFAHGLPTFAVSTPGRSTPP